jgi:serine/threonine protein kinase
VGTPFYQPLCISFKSRSPRVVMIARGTRLNGKWTVGAKLAEGACGEVYELQERDPAIGDLVVKCIALPNPKSSKAQQKAQSRVADTLYYENVLYTNGLFHGFVQGAKVPRGAYGEDHGVRYLVMERLGFPLSTWTTRTDCVTPAKISAIGLQILAGLEFIHNKVPFRARDVVFIMSYVKQGYVYIDIKPDNFMIKVTNNVEKLYFIDFGLMEKFMSVMSAGHREMQHRNVIAGTAQFVSVDVHNGGVPSRKDDIEAMVLVSCRLHYDS